VKQLEGVRAWWKFRNDLLFAVLYWDRKMDSMEYRERKRNYYSLIDQGGLDALGNLAHYEQRCCTGFSYLWPKAMWKTFSHFCLIVLAAYIACTHAFEGASPNL
jgi:hypothetical protein